MFLYLCINISSISSDTLFQRQVVKLIVMPVWAFCLHVCLCSWSAPWSVLWCGRGLLTMSETLNMTGEYSASYILNCGMQTHTLHGFQMPGNSLWNLLKEYWKISMPPLNDFIGPYSVFSWRHCSIYSDISSNTIIIVRLSTYLQNLPLWAVL